MTKNWTIVGQDLLSVVSCKEPYEWKDLTEEEWEFSGDAKQSAAATKHFKVRLWNYLLQIVDMGWRQWGAVA